MIVFSVSSFTSFAKATRTSKNFTRHRHRHHHRKTSSSQNVRSSSGKGGDDDGDEHHHHHHAPSSSLVVNRRAVVLERPAKLAVLSFLLLLSSSSSSPDNDAFAKGGKSSLEEKERAKDARKRALRAAAERAKETGVGGAAFSDSEYMVGEDHSPNQHSHQEEGSKGSFV